MNMYTSYSETYIDVPCKVFESPMHYSKFKYIHQTKQTENTIDLRNESAQSKRVLI